MGISHNFNTFSLKQSMKLKILVLMVLDSFIKLLNKNKKNKNLVSKINVSNFTHFLQDKNWSSYKNIFMKYLRICSEFFFLKVE